MSKSHDLQLTVHSADDTELDRSKTHPICEGAPDKEKCEAFVERLIEASNNIDRTA